MQPNGQIETSHRTAHPLPPDLVASVPEAGKIYGSFWLDDTEFALRADVVQEVVNEPSEISSVPLSPLYMRGLFNFRGRIIPIVDLRIFLGFPDTEVQQRRVAIVEDGDLCIGLMIDRTGEVLNSQGAARIGTRPNSSHPKDVAVEEILKFEGGNRIVQILDPRELLNLKNVPRSESSADEGAKRAAASRGSRFNCISFQFGHTTCAIDLSHIVEVMEAPKITESILVHDCFIGTINLRGRIIPVADLRNFMGDRARLKESKSPSPRRKILIIETEGGLIGLLVFSINSIISAFPDEILSFTKLAMPREDIVKGCLSSGGDSIILLLDHDALKRDRLLIETARRCEEIYPVASQDDAVKEAQASLARLTYIVFSFGKSFALDTARVSEVIDYTKSMVRPPYGNHYLDGIFDLRGELINLINPRKVYGMPEVERSGERVVIFKHGGDKYGLVTDSIDEIVNTSDSQYGGLGMPGSEPKSTKVARDISGCIQSPTRGPVVILDIDAFMERCFEGAGAAEGGTPF